MPTDAKRDAVADLAGRISRSSIAIATDFSGLGVNNLTELRKRLREQGVEPVDRDDFRAAIREATDGRGVDLVLDPVGGDHLLQSYRCLASGGRVVSYGISAMAPGRKRSRLAQLREWWRTPRFNPLWMMGANRAVIGVHLGRYRDVERLQQAQAQLFDWLEAGEIAPRIDSVFPGAEAAKAHQHIHDRQNIGKVLLDFD